MVWAMRIIGPIGNHKLRLEERVKILYESIIELYIKKDILG